MPQTGDLGNQRLMNRNVTIAGRRTCVRLEPMIWDTLRAIADRDNLSLAELCSRIDQWLPASRRSSFSSAIRLYILNDALGAERRRAAW